MIFTRARELGGDEPFAKMFARAREPFPTKRVWVQTCRALNSFDFVEPKAAWKRPDKTAPLAHLPGNVCQNQMIVSERDTEHGSRKHRHDVDLAARARRKRRIPRTRRDRGSRGQI
jgi:hypothetical protein